MSECSQHSFLVAWAVTMALICYIMTFKFLNMLFFPEHFQCCQIHDRRQTQDEADSIAPPSRSERDSGGNNSRSNSAPPTLQPQDSAGTTKDSSVGRSPRGMTRSKTPDRLAPDMSTQSNAKHQAPRASTTLTLSNNNSASLQSTSRPNSNLSRSDTRGKVHGSKRDGTQLLPFFRVTSCLVFAMFAFGVTASLLVWVPICLEGEDWSVFNLIFGGCYAISLFLLVAIFIKRLDVVLGSSSKYKLSERVFTMLWSALGVIVCAGVASLGLYYVNRVVAIVCFGVCAVGYVLICVTLLALFLRNLSKLAKALNATMAMAGGSSNDRKLDKKLTKLIDVMTRYTILITTSLVSSFVISFLLWGLLDVDSSLTLNTDTVVNCICLYFQFKFTQHEYKLVCHCCHERMQTYFVGMVVETRNDQEEKEVVKLNL